MANLKTIRDIRNVRDKIRGQIKNLDLKKYKDQTFGPEGEYTFRGMIGGLESILTDISTLTQYESRFVKLSTYQGRNNIHQFLINIQNTLKDPNNLYQHIDKLKEELRNYNIRNFSEHLIEFNKEIDEIRKLKLTVQESLKEINESKVEIEKKHLDANDSLKEINEELAHLKESIVHINVQSESLKNTNAELLSIKMDSQKIHQGIQEHANEAKANSKLIDSFAKNVEERNKKLVEIEQRTEENELKLSEYEEERESILIRANELISSAKKALNYKTAEGLSDSFSTQYDKASNKWVLGGWLVAAAIALLTSVWLGINIIENVEDQWFLVMSRILLLPLPISAVVFCAQQYNKQKNIIEDYAYKTTIARAIVGFSEQLKKNSKDDNSEYVEYIQKALGEIHRDPLRNRKEDRQEVMPTSQVDQIIEMANKIVDFSKSNSPN